MSANYSPAAPVNPPQKSSGCLKWGVIGCGAALVLLAAFVVVIVVVVFGAMKKSDVYREALRRAQNDPAVTAALGTPVEDGFYVTGSVNLDSSGGHATLDFPISGPKGKGSVHLVATKTASAWDYSVLTVTLANGSVINLQPSPAPPATSTEPASSSTPATTETTGTDTGTGTGTGTESTTST